MRIAHKYVVKYVQILLSIIDERASCANLCVYFHFATKQCVGLDGVHGLVV